VEIPKRKSRRIVAVHLLDALLLTAFYDPALPLKSCCGFGAGVSSSFDVLRVRHVYGHFVQRPYRRSSRILKPSQDFYFF
jgi:hypothetical protein